MACFPQIYRVPILALIFLVGIRQKQFAEAFPFVTLRGRSTRHQNCALDATVPSSILENYDDFRIRDCLYTDLNDVTEILLQSFYSKENLLSPWKHLYRYRELGRLQSNFPYGDTRQMHRMLVAVNLASTAPTNQSNDGKEPLAEVVAFCDLDSSPATRWQDPPRPYLSDLAVDSNHRRRGIARALIQLCERIVVDTMQQSSLYIRVEQENDIAIEMYRRLEYQRQAHPIFGVKDSTMLLRKLLSQEHESKVLDTKVGPILSFEDEKNVRRDGRCSI